MLPSAKCVISVAITAAALACTDKLYTGFGDSTADAGNAKPLQAPPVFNGVATQADTAPRPMSGGTLITMAVPNGPALAIASDPDEDAVDVVTLGAKPALLGQVLLSPGDEPGRLVADAAGLVHVILRGGGGVATINPMGPSLIERRSVCAAPRGIDYDAKRDSIVVVCAAGELAVFPAGGGDATLSTVLDRDLRDVVVDGDTLYVTRLRSAEVLTLDMTGHVANRTLPLVTANGSPDVAWRAVRNPAGGVLVLHQIASTETIIVDPIPAHHAPDAPPPPPAYGGNVPTDPQSLPTPPVVIAAVTAIGGTASTGSAVALSTNPVIDIAVSADGMFETIGVLGVIEVGTPNGGSFPFDSNMSGFISLTAPDEFVAIADARATSSALVVQRRSSIPALIVIPTNSVQQGGCGQCPPPLPDHDPIQSVTITLPQRQAHNDTGFDVFHVPTSGGIACMNCHPEGADDSHTWKFNIKNQLRVRRTQNLRGGVIADSAPYHWDGDMPSLEALCDEIFTHRMGGGSVLPAQALLLSRFLNGIPRLPVFAGLDQAAVDKGRAIFNGSGGCIGCHAGPVGTSPNNQDVGKTDSFGASLPMQVPMLLGVADRAPYMHDGCAATLMDRLTNPACAGKKHGNTAGLTPTDQTNLVQYLESL